MADYGFKRSKFVFCNALLTLLALMLLTACGGLPFATEPAPVVMKTYQGDGFTLKYPENWKVSEQTGQISFNSPDEKATFAITIQKNPDELVPAETMKNGAIDGIKGTGNLKDEEIEATKTINGVTWQQAAIAGETGDGTKTANVKFVILVTNQPEKSADTVAYLIIYGAEQDVFEEQNTKNLQPMAESVEIVKK